MLDPSGHFSELDLRGALVSGRTSSFRPGRGESGPNAVSVTGPFEFETSNQSAASCGKKISMTAMITIKERQRVLIDNL
jgi:hypothetical protein